MHAGITTRMSYMCVAYKIPEQMPTETHDFEKCS